MAHNHQRVIEARKKVDAKYKEMASLQAEDRKILQIASFENNSTLKIEANAKTELLESRKAEWEVELYNRRCMLAELYNEEITGWRNEVLSKVESQESRKERIMERACALRDARESQRLKLVQEKYDIQWRDACDDARTLDSKAMTQHMNKSRLQQIEDKIVRKTELSKNENSFLAEWNRQLDEVAARDKAKQDNKARISKETSDHVQQQIEENMYRRERHLQNLKEEEFAELARLRAEIDDDEALQKQRHDNEMERGKMVRHLNEQDQAVKDSETSVDKERDIILLNYALRKEAEKHAAEEALKFANKESAKQYQKYLQELMIKEGEDTAFVDEINRKEAEKVWKARDDALQARADARDNLLHMVDDGRKEQIRYKEEALQREREEGKKFADNFLNEAREAVEKERLAAEARRIKNVENNGKLSEQINYRKYKEELEKQEIYLADKHMRYIERQHIQKLAEQGGAIRLHRPMKKTDLS